MKFDRKREALCVGVAVFLMVAGLIAGSLTQPEKQEITQLSRGETAADVLLYVKQAGQESQPVAIHIESREKTVEEIERILEQAYSEILDELKGENPSLQEIRTDLHMTYSRKIAGEEIEVFWQVPEGIPMTSMGTVQSLETETEGDIYMRLSCGDVKREWNIHLTFLSKNEIKQTLSDYIQEKVDSQKGKDTVALPLEFDGAALTYQDKEKESLIMYVLPGLLAGILLWLMFYRKQEREKEQRKKELERDYPDLSIKIALLYGAGLSMRSVWERLVKESSVGIYLKEEIQRVIHKIANGTPETIAYWEFGELCGSQEYRKLAGILEQTVTKGTKGLTQMLNEVARESLQERKASAKRKGEEINTKLLLPMGIILVVIIALIMIPALGTMKNGL